MTPLFVRRAIRAIRFASDPATQSRLDRSDWGAVSHHNQNDPLLDVPDVSSAAVRYDFLGRSESVV